MKKKLFPNIDVTTLSIAIPGGSDKTNKLKNEGKGCLVLGTFQKRPRKVSLK